MCFRKTKGHNAHPAYSAEPMKAFHIIAYMISLSKERRRCNGTNAPAHAGLLEVPKMVYSPEVLEDCLFLSKLALTNRLANS